ELAVAEARADALEGRPDRLGAALDRIPGAEQGHVGAVVPQRRVGLVVAAAHGAQRGVDLAEGIFELAAQEAALRPLRGRLHVHLVRTARDPRIGRRCPTCRSWLPTS